MTSFVLVHGAWHGGWCWRRVAERLRQAGHDVFTPSLTGLGDRAHLLGRDINLSTHIQDIHGIMDSYDLGDVVLCGHSYGGLIITATADRLPERVRSLVYLDALVPEDGQSMFDMIPDSFVEVFEQGAREGDGFSVPPMSAEQFGVNAVDADWMNSKCVNHPIGCFTEPLTLAGTYRQIQRPLYVLAEGFEHPSTHAHHAAFKEDPAWDTVILQGGHDLMLDNADAVTELLLQRA